MNWDGKFWKGVFSEADGTPSSSRILIYLLSFVCCYCLVVIVRAMVGMPTDRVTVWLTSLPWIIGAFVGLIGAPYAINQGRNVFSDIATMLANYKK